MVKAGDSSKIATPLAQRLKTSLTTRLLDNLTPTMTINKDNEVDKSGGGETNKNLAKF